MKRPINRALLVKSFFIIFILCIGITGGIVFATTGDSATITSGGFTFHSGLTGITYTLSNPQSSYDYIFYSVGGIVLVKNGTSGAIVTSGSDFSTIINTLINKSMSILLVGNFSVSTTIHITSQKVTIAGTGKYNTFLNGTTTGDLLQIDHANYFTLRDLYIDGLHNVYDGINITHSYLFMLDNLVVQNTEYDGIWVGGDGLSGNGHIQNCYVEGHKHDCISTYQMVDCWVQNNDLGNCEEDVLELVGGATNTITGNKVYMGGWLGSSWNTVAGEGLRLYDEWFDIVSDNSFRENALRGIWGTFVRNSTFSNNICSYNDMSNTGGFMGGFYLDDSNYTVVTGGLYGSFETVAGTNPWGILTDNGCDYIVIGGVLTHGNTAGGIYVEDNSTVRIYDSMLEGVWIADR